MAEGRGKRERGMMRKEKDERRKRQRERRSEKGEGEKKGGNKEEGENVTRCWLEERRKKRQDISKGRLVRTREEKKVVGDTKEKEGDEMRRDRGG